MSRYTVIVDSQIMIEHHASGMEYGNAIAEAVNLMSQYIAQSKVNSATNVGFGNLEGDTGYYLHFEVETLKIDVLILEEKADE